VARTQIHSKALKGRVKAHDPFELIRWLALSQPDPRKALAELVQNSLDAGATHIRVTRQRVKGVPCLRVFDDGEGVIPEMARPDALKYIATHIGHSRKRSLSPEERLQLMTQGQYGIGLLGFWSIGQRLEMRSAVPGQQPNRLALYRDRPEFVIEPLRGRLPLEDRWTEVIVAAVHPEAMPALGGRRAADYLASELRGQLLHRGVELVVEDRMARGRAQKIARVRPPRFVGERLEGIGPVEVPGYPPIRLELYVANDNGEGFDELALYSAGTLVAESFRMLSPLGLDHPPWTDPRLTGLVDFPAFRVSPGSRRNIVLDQAAGVFARALRTLEPVVEGALEKLARERQAEVDKSLVRDLQRAFRDFYRQQPRYALLPVRGGEGQSEGPEAQASEGVAAAEEPSALDGEATAALPEVDLLPPGPLASVRLTPSPFRVECGGLRRTRAQALDDAGRPITSGVFYEWSVTGPVGTLTDTERHGNTVRLQAPDTPGIGTIAVCARQNGRQAAAELPVEVVEELGPARSDEGIPKPEFVHHPGARWRSRVVDGRWEVNSGHREYRAIAERPALKLRYLAMLFAKEVVVRSHSDPRLEEPLEQLVEVAAYADRNLASRVSRRRQSRPKLAKDG
jgi:hypothetical protein